MKKSLLAVFALIGAVVFRLQSRRSYFQFHGWSRVQSASRREFPSQSCYGRKRQ